MTVGDSSLRARSQCIAIWRRYERRGTQLAITMANPGPMCARGLSPWEMEFDRTLSGMSSASRAGDTLRLAGPAGDLVFSVVPAPPREVFTGRWRLLRLNGAPPADRTIEIAVTPDRITANACVFAGWRYRQDGQLLEATPLDQPVCERTLTEVERRFARFMSGLTRATLTPDGSLILDSASEQAEFGPLEGEVTRP